MSYIYPGQLATAAMTANVKCVVTQLYVNVNMGSNASRLEPLSGGSFRFTTKVPEIPGTHFINPEKMKG